jgi:multicomponent Na+:H+ antiporter subunit D
MSLPVPVLAVAVPLAVAVLIVVSARVPNVRETWTVLGSLSMFAVVAATLPAVIAGEVPEADLLALAPGVSLALRADPAGMIFAALASALWALTSLYSIGYVRGTGEGHQTRYYASFAVCLAATAGLAFSANLFTFFIFYELLTVATYPLVTHKGTEEARRAGRRYLGYLLTGGAALLLAMGTVWAGTGTLEFEAGGFVAGQLSGPQTAFVALLFLIGFGTKSALMPMHAWLPAAMVAPTPVSALLHAVAVVKAGIFGFVRAVGYVIGPDELARVGVGGLLTVMAAVTIVVASLIALRQDNLKRRLAFSTVAHLAYIVCGLSLVTATAWNGAMLHMVNHAALKITLFFCAGALYATAHLDRVSQLDGIGRRMPVTMGAFALASIGLAGLPPMGGFWSKWFLALGALDAEAVVLAIVLLGSGLLTAGYLFPIVYRAFFVAPPPDAGHGHGEASVLMAGPLAATAVIGLLLGVTNLLGLEPLAEAVAAAVTGGAS